MPNSEYESIDNQAETILKPEPETDYLSLSNQEHNALNFDHHDLKLSYRDHEQELKIKYYKSNPLRAYAPTKGQSILPDRSESSTSKKKQLPDIYNELRVTKDFEEDRDLHRQKIRSKLNLNLNFLEQKKSPIDQLENSKKIYSEYCKLNLTKPIDLTNVESILKQTLSVKKRNLNSNFNSKREHYASISDNESSDSSLNLSSLNEKPNHLSKSADLLIDAQTVEIKGIEEISRELRNHKVKLAKMNAQTRLENYRQSYRMVKSGSSINNIQHKGSIYNYRQAVKALNSQTRLDSAPSLSISAPSSLLNGEVSELKKSRTKLVSRSLIDTDVDEVNGDFIHLRRVLDSATITQEEKHQNRVRMAREKILTEQIEKHNLNKMTILQPFEDTKILINIDKVPSRLLNSLLHKEHIAPRYFMPPIRAFGYFKKVVDESSLNGNTIGLTSSSGLIGSKSLRNLRSREHQHQQHNFTLETLKSLNESQYSNSAKSKANKKTSLSNNSGDDGNGNGKSKSSGNNESSVNFDLKVNMIAKDVSVR